MKSDSRIHKVDGIDLGECLEIVAHSDEEFVLTIIEPEYYGDGRQVSSMALTRKQAKKIIKAMKVVLNEE